MVQGIIWNVFILDGILHLTFTEQAQMLVFASLLLFKISLEENKSFGGWQVKHQGARIWWDTFFCFVLFFKSRFLCVRCGTLLPSWENFLLHHHFAECSIWWEWDQVCKLVLFLCFLFFNLFHFNFFGGAWELSWERREVGGRGRRGGGERPLARNTWREGEGL